jgi:hypothetical protein
MTLPPLPPRTLVLESLQLDVLPAAGAGAFILCAFLLVGRWAGALGSAAAVTVAFMVANFTLNNVGFEDKPTWDNTARLIPWKPKENAPGWHWLPRAAAVLVVVGLLSRWIGLLATRLLPERFWWGANLLVWAPRLAGVIVVSAWIASGPAASKPEWEHLRLQLAACMFAIWIALDGVARAEAGAEVAAYMGLCFFAAAIILIYAHSKFFMDMAVIFSFAMFGIAAAAAVGKADTSGAIPASVVFLPGLIFGTKPSMEVHKVPEVALWLVVLAPLVLLPFLIPVLSRQRGWIVRSIRAVVILAPVIVAVTLAAQHEKLPFDEEEQTNAAANP